MEVLELLSDFALVPRPTEAEKEAVSLHVCILLQNKVV